jgi:hypothetical protein
MSYDYFIVYTNIFHSITKNIHPNDKCICDENYNWCDTCYCPKDPRVTGILINVDVVGNPIKTKPIDSVYNVKIYKIEKIQSECNNKYDFTDEDIVSEFTMAHSLSQEYPDTYVEYAKTYLQYKSDTIEINKLNYKFKAMKMFSKSC